MKFAVIGNPIAHSLSPGIHQNFAESAGISLSYERMLVESHLEQHIRQFFAAKGAGLNITAPYKEEAFQLSDIQTARCLLAKAANTLWMKDGLIYADNTDGVGLCRSLAREIKLQGASILMIGCGGAARGVIPALLEAGAVITITHRHFEKALAFSDSMKEKIKVIHPSDPKEDFDLVINATSIHLDTSQLCSAWLNKKPFCYDIIYHASRATPFTTWANAHDCKAQDGYSMLVEQAAEAFYIWHGVRPRIRV